MNIYIHLPHDKALDRAEADFAAGATPDKVAYGFHHVRDLAVRSRFPDSPPDRWASRFARRASLRLLGFDLLHAWHNRSRIDSADAVWTMLETEYLAVNFVLLVRPWVGRKIVLAQSVWLFDRMQRRKMRLATFLARRSSVLMTHSQRCLPLMQKAFPATRQALMHFGISSDAFPLTSPKSPRRDGAIRIFAAGNDPTRDWKTLLEAYGNDDRFELTVVCGWLTPREIAHYRNVQLVTRPTIAEFRDLYVDADFTVVPMTPNIYSGITVALESVAMGTPVISASTGGVSTYFDSTEAAYYIPGDAADLRRATLSISPEQRFEYVSRAQRRFAERGYTTRAMVGRYLALTRRLMDGDENAFGAVPTMLLQHSETATPESCPHPH